MTRPTMLSEGEALFCVVNHKGACADWGDGWAELMGSFLMTGSGARAGGAASSAPRQGFRVLLHPATHESSHSPRTGGVSHSFTH